MLSSSCSETLSLNPFFAIFPMAVQAIAGVSASSEAIVMTEYPSISSGGIGQLLGSIYESIPLPFGLPKLSYVFALMTAPLGLLLYALQKLFGKCYVLTNREVQIWTSRSQVKLSSVDLDKVTEVELEQQSGQVFFDASDIRLKGSNGETLLKLTGVKDAGSFRNAIKCAVDARRMVQKSMARIAARG